MKNYTDNPLWYKEFKKDQIWIKRTNNVRTNFIKILSVVNLKNKKIVRVEWEDGSKHTYSPGDIFFNFIKK